MKGTQAEPRTGKNFAYKAIFAADGLVFLFEKITSFTPEDVKINVCNGELFLELGNNVALITERILKHLIGTRQLFLYKSLFSGYEAQEQVVAFEAESEVLARIQGAWEIIKATGNKTQKR